MSWEDCEDEDSDTDPMEQVLHERLLSLGLVIVRGKHGVSEVPESRVDLVNVGSSQDTVTVQRNKAGGKRKVREKYIIANKLRSSSVKVKYQLSLPGHQSEDLGQVDVPSDAFQYPKEEIEFVKDVKDDNLLQSSDPSPEVSSEVDIDELLLSEDERESESSLVRITDLNKNNLLEANIKNRPLDEFYSSSNPCH